MHIDHDALKQGMEFIDSIKKSGNTKPVEVHNRYNILWLADAKLDPTIEPRHIGIDLDELDYSRLKLVLGTYMLSVREHPGNKSLSRDDIARLKFFQDEIHKRKYRLNFDGERIEMRYDVFQAMTAHAFGLTTDTEIRECDFRMLVQFTSPYVWSKCPMGGAVLHYDQPKLELKEVSRLTGHRASIVVHINAFAEEFMRYLQEHWKVQASIGERVAWINQCIDAYKANGTPVLTH